MIENPPENGNRFTVAIYRRDTEEKIYQSGYLDPGQVMETAPLDAELAEGEYTVTGKTKTGESIQFYANGEVTTEQKVTISSEKALWEGHHYVSWDKADGDPNKSFNLIPQEVMTALKPGTILRVYYSIEPTAEYHQMQLATGWWTGLMDKIEFSEDGVYELIITQEVIDKINAEAGFLCVGHGYYVDLVTVQ